MEKSNKPIKSFFLDYLDWLEIEKGLSSKTQENYSRFLKKFFEFLHFKGIDNIKAHELEPEHIWDYHLFLSRQYLKKNKRPLKKTTQAYYLIALRSFLSFLTEKDILCLPPEKIKLPRTKKERIVSFLTLEQVKKLLNAPDTNTLLGLRDRAILETLFSTGLRVSELISLDRKQIKIKPKTKSLEVTIIGKGDYPRTVYFSQSAVYWLREYLKTRTDKIEALFISYQGQKPRGRISARTAERIVKKYALLAGLPITTTCHTLRHSFATDLLMKGVDLRTVQEFLGHRNIATTQVYTHITKRRLKEIHEKFHGF